MTNHVFISYSDGDALDFTRQLADELEGGEDQYVDAWWDKRDIDAGRDWDDQVVEAIRSCKCMVFVLTAESTAPGSTCKNEWTWALKYKKPVVPIRLQRDVEQPFGLGNRQWIDFTGEFEAGLARLRKFLRHMDSPEGQLDSLKDRLADAERDLRRALTEDKPRIQAEINELSDQIKTQQKIVDNPQAAQEQTQKNIETGLEREREPAKPITVRISTKIINSPPSVAPAYFQDRVVETKQIVDFLNDDSQRLMTIVGRGGVGKTAMVCRLLKGLEAGKLPDGLGTMKREGIVYLSESGNYHVNFANIFYGLSELLPAESKQQLDAIYKNPQASTESKMNALLAKFSGERVVLLLDNFESLVDIETFAIRDTELDEALRAFLKGAHSSVKILITTRVAPQKLNLFQPGRQRPPLILDEGLESPYAENILKEMDKDGLVGLKSASDAVLHRARERTRGYPRALEALFAILASDRYTTLGELLDKPTPENVVEELVGEAFDRLDMNAQKIMQALAVYNRPVTPAAVDYLLLPHLPAMDSALILKRLVNMHFVRRFEGERFYLHPIDREFAFTSIPLLPASSLLLLREEQDEVSQFIQHDLTIRAADYFAQARKPRTEWKKLDDLSAQLAEFDLRCAAGDYDTACSVLSEIDSNYLLLWGHYRLIIDLNLRIKDKLQDRSSFMINMNSLGNSYRFIGQVREAIVYFEHGLLVAQQEHNRLWEETFLGNLGGAYYFLGNTSRAINYFEQALVIDREVGDEIGEGTDLLNIGSVYANIGDARKAIGFYEQALTIFRNNSDRPNEEVALFNLAEIYLDNEQYDKALLTAEESLKIALEINIPTTYEYSNLASAYLYTGNLEQASHHIEQANSFDEPQINHEVSTLQGIISLRQRDVSAARQAFRQAIRHADEILAKTPEFYTAVDAKGLALLGLALCTDGGKFTVDSGKTVAEATEEFRRARKIAPHAGVVKRVLRLFDELVKCDEEGILKDMRRVVEGKE